MTTLADLLENIDALRAKFGDGPLAYADVSRTQLSIARFSGGCKVNGKHYIYNPKEDSLIREDVLKFLGKLEKEKEKQAKLDSVSKNTQVEMGL